MADPFQPRSDDANSGSGHATKLLRRGTLVLLLVFAGVALFMAIRSPPPVEILLMSQAAPAVKSPAVQRLKTWVPIWVWRVKTSILGARKTMRIDADVLDVKGWPPARWPEFSLSEPTFETADGLQFWILNENELIEMRLVLQGALGAVVVASPRFYIAHKVQASMSQTYSVSIGGRSCNVGLEASVYPRIRSDATKLDMVLCHTVAVTNSPALTGGLPPANVVSLRTNLAVSARIRIPNGKGVLLVNSGHETAGGGRMVVLIPALKPPNKR